MVETVEIGNLGMRMRIGFRDALDELTKRYKESDDANIRRTERILLDSIAADYEDRWSAKSAASGGAQQALSAYAVLVAHKQVPISVANLVKAIREEKDLEMVCGAFLVLRQSTGVHFPMFDVEAVGKWCQENSSKCR